MKIHFISGLPRSGSTLLAALLRQHPDLSVVAHSPVLGMINGVMPIMGNSEFSSRFTRFSRRSTIRGLIEGYHASRGGGQIAIDGNRMWTSMLPLIDELYPDAKVIACVRPLGDIANSFEKFIAAHPFNDPSFRMGATVHKRVEKWMERGGIMGSPLSALTDALAGKFKDRILLVKYENLCATPQMVIDTIMDFLKIGRISLELDCFSHTDDLLDFYLDAPGLHTVNAPVRLPDREVIIPRVIYDRLNGEDVPWNR